jgi:ABC-type multidrug transport system ATPase subunit
MGPSGAGKSSLLECVCGKRSKGLSGDIHISGTDTIKVGFVEQFDHLLERLTVKESIIFASRLRNADRQYVDHETIALNLIEELGLEVCAQTHAIGCSGGQRKRLSIALELVSKANILVLDEPTSGLDSSATSQTIKAMVSLTKQVSLSLVYIIFLPIIYYSLNISFEEKAYGSGGHYSSAECNYFQSFQ